MVPIDSAQHWSYHAPFRRYGDFVMNQIFPETRMFRLSDGEEIMTLAFFVLIQYRTVADGQTDRRKDGRTDMSALAIALA